MVTRVRVAAAGLAVLALSSCASDASPSDTGPGGKPASPAEIAASHSPNAAVVLAVKGRKLCLTDRAQVLACQDMSELQGTRYHSVLDRSQGLLGVATTSDAARVLAFNTNEVELEELPGTELVGGVFAVSKEGPLVNLTGVDRDGRALWVWKDGDPAEY